MEPSARRAAKGNKEAPPYMHDFFCSPPIYFLKDKWQDYRDKRREHKRASNSDTNKAIKSKTNDATPSTATEAQASTAFTMNDPNAQYHLLDETQGPLVPDMDAHIELREVLETNLGEINRPSE